MKTSFSMNLRQRFAAKDTAELIGILENCTGYTAEAYGMAEEELLSRQLPYEDLKAQARQLVVEKARTQMDRLDPLNDELVPVESYFLSKSEVKKIYLAELKALMERKEGFRFDVWKYAIGGF